MKKKYTLVIADVEMNVVTEASWESVEKIVGILDRKMRDINLKSYRCTKNQAALLCALEYCSEKLELQERNDELEQIAQQDADIIEEKDRKIAELEAEIARLQGENEIMNGILERAAASTERFMGHTEQIAKQTAEQEEQPAEQEEAAEADVQPIAQEPAQEVAEQLTVDFDPVAEIEEEAVNTKAAQVLEEIATEQSEVPRVKAKVKKTKSRSRVGSMFDLLTFNDV